MKKLRKLAVIRDNEDSPCPFGLPIVQACFTAGDSVDDMEIVTDTQAEKPTIEHNLAILNKNVEQKKCKYAAHLFKNKEHSVDCDFGDTAAGLSQDVSFLGSPYYTQIDKGVGIGGLSNYPVTYQTDGSEYRSNLYYGMYGWASDRQIRSLLRQSLLEVLKSHES